MTNEEDKRDWQGPPDCAASSAGLPDDVEDHKCPECGNKMELDDFPDYAASSAGPEQKKYVCRSCENKL